MNPAGPTRRHGSGEARGAAIEGAADALDAELVRAPVDAQFALVLRACAHGGRRALETLCNSIDDPSGGLTEAPALALVEAVAEQVGAQRGLRAAVWMMVAQRVAETWPSTWFDVLVVAREAMALDESTWQRVRQSALLNTAALMTEDPAERDGMHFQFSRESLETVIGAATGRLPARRDMLEVIPHWTAAFLAGIKACDAHLHEQARTAEVAAPPP